MTDEQKADELNKLHERLDHIKEKLNKSPANTSLRIKKRKIKREIAELRMTMTDEDFEKLLTSRSEINTSKC